MDISAPSAGWTYVDPTERLSKTCCAFTHPKIRPIKGVRVFSDYIRGSKGSHSKAPQTALAFGHGLPLKTTDYATKYVKNVSNMYIIAQENH